MSMWPWISLERESFWRWSPRKSSSQCHNNPVLVPLHKPPDPVKDLYGSNTYDLKTRVDIFAQKFDLTMWFFQFITGITFKWYYAIRWIVALLVWIGLWNKLRIYRVPPDPVRWSCRSFGFLWQLFMLNWMLWTKNDLKIFQSKQVNTPPKIKLVTSFMNFECQPCGIFEGLSYHKEDEVIDPIIFAATVGLGSRIKKLVSSNFMGMVSLVSVILTLELLTHVIPTRETLWSLNRRSSQESSKA